MWVLVAGASARLPLFLFCLFLELMPVNAFADNHIKYANSYCWIRNTYYLPFEDEIPKPDDHREMVTYYQWVPFILLAMAVLFYLPNVVWHGLNQRSGVDADNILQSAQSLTNVSQEDNRENTLTVLTNLMDRFLGKRRLASENNKSCSGFRRLALFFFAFLPVISAENTKKKL